MRPGAARLSGRTHRPREANRSARAPYHEKQRRAGDAPKTSLPRIERSSLHILQVHDLADTIDLEVAREALSSTSARMRPIASRGASIDMPQLPLIVALGGCVVSLAGEQRQARVTARVYDLGIVAVTISVGFHDPLPWAGAIDLIADAQARPSGAADAFASAVETLKTVLRPALQRPNAEMRTEDYAVLTIERLGAGAPASHLAHNPVLLRAALGERKALSANAATLATALSYFEDDLMLLTWTAALVIEPEASAREDALFLLEFANVQLLAFRSYDAEVERDLARLAPRIARNRRPNWWTQRNTTAFLHDIHALITDTTELSSRVENALKVTEDVYWNRVHAAAVQVLRVGVWRAGLLESLDVLRQTASLLNDEAESARATVLEWLIILLIMLELIVAVVGLRH